MRSDIYFESTVDLVIFTVVDQKSLAEKIWDESLVSPAPNKKDTGLGLYVVTVPTDRQRYQGEVGQRMLPGGHLGQTETLMEASHRIAAEQLGLSLKTRIRQLGTFDDPDRVRGNRAISFAYWGMVNFEDLRRYLGGKEQIGLELVNSKMYRDMNLQFLRPFSDYDGVCRFGYRTMPSVNLNRGHSKVFTNRMPEGRILALDHDQMVFYAWRQLRHAFDGKLDPFRFLGINPLGVEFRLSDLREFTEVCRGEDVQTDWFRRQMTGDNSFVRLTGKTDKDRPGKPANMYELGVNLPDSPDQD